MNNFNKFALSILVLAYAGALSANPNVLMRVKINNKTTKNYFLTNAQEFDFKTNTMKTSAAQQDALNAGIKAGGSYEFSFYFPEASFQESMFYIMDDLNKPQLRIYIADDTRQSKIVVELHRFIDQGFTMESLRKDSLIVYPQEGVQVGYGITIDLNGENLQNSDFEITAFEKNKFSL